MNVKKVIKKWLKPDGKIFYILYCVDNMKSKKFREKVLKIKTNPNQMEFVHNGEDFSGKIIYKITVGDETKGFCSAIRDTIYYLMYADSLGMYPYIEYTPNMPYQENHMINCGSNSFSYFFDQPFPEIEKVIGTASAIVQNESIHTEGVFSLRGIEEPTNYYVNSPEHIDACASIYGKYLKLKDGVRKQLELEAKELIGEGKVLGVHYRGTDFKVGYNGHPVAVPYQKHIEETKKRMQKETYDKVFLATEDGDVIDAFKNAFGEKIVLYSDVVRGTGETNAYNMRSDRPDHKYRLAYEVLRDVYTLARCDGFITSMSGVGITSQIMKKSSGKEFSFLEMLEAGINKSSKVLQKNKY